MNLHGKNRALDGLGSYLVNALEGLGLRVGIGGSGGRCSSHEGFGQGGLAIRGVGVVVGVGVAGICVAVGVGVQARTWTKAPVLALTLWWPGTTPVPETRSVKSQLLVSQAAAVSLMMPPQISK
jgi:hypothetical protein